MNSDNIDIHAVLGISNPNAGRPVIKCTHENCKFETHSSGMLSYHKLKNHGDFNCTICNNHVSHNIDSAASHATLCGDNLMFCSLCYGEFTSQVIKANGQVKCNKWVKYHPHESCQHTASSDKPMPKRVYAKNMFCFRRCLRGERLCSYTKRDARNRVLDTIGGPNRPVAFLCDEMAHGHPGLRCPFLGRESEMFHRHLTQWHADKEEFAVVVYNNTALAKQMIADTMRCGNALLAIGAAGYIYAFCSPSRISIVVEQHIDAHVPPTEWHLAASRMRQFAANGCECSISFILFLVGGEEATKIQRRNRFRQFIFNRENIGRFEEVFFFCEGIYGTGDGKREIDDLAAVEPCPPTLTDGGEQCEFDDTPKKRKSPPATTAIATKKKSATSAIATKKKSATTAIATKKTSAATTAAAKKTCSITAAAAKKTSSTTTAAAKKKIKTSNVANSTNSFLTSATSIPLASALMSAVSAKSNNTVSKRTKAVSITPNTTKFASTIDDCSTASTSIKDQK